METVISFVVTLVNCWVLVCPVLGDPAVQPGELGQLKVSEAFAAHANHRNRQDATTAIRKAAGWAWAGIR